MKIYSLALIMPLGLLSSQALAFYQEPAPLMADESRPAVEPSQPFIPLSAKSFASNALAGIIPDSYTGTPVFGCNCAFCSMLRQAGSLDQS